MMKWTFAWLNGDILLISSYGANSHQKEKKLWSTSATGYKQLNASPSS
jgi:hypothetical protein